MMVNVFKNIQLVQEFLYVNVIMVLDVNSLSLDAILGYHIRVNLNISHQPLPVLISLILTVIITLFGLVNGILLFITFKNKSIRESGCGNISIQFINNYIINNDCFFFIEIFVSFTFTNGINYKSIIFINSMLFN